MYYAKGLELGERSIECEESGHIAPQMCGRVPDETGGDLDTERIQIAVEPCVGRAQKERAREVSNGVHLLLLRCSTGSA